MHQPGLLAVYFICAVGKILTVKPILWLSSWGLEFMKAENRGLSRKKANRSFARMANVVASKSGNPVTFLLALVVILVWALSGPFFKFNDTWQLVINTGTTIVTFLMVFLIQNTQSRDNAAVQLKLDELIRAVGTAENKAINLESKTLEELEQLKKRYSQLALMAQNEIQE
jgi:low affinity Fe/Cu permease